MSTNPKSSYHGHRNFLSQLKLSLRRDQQSSLFPSKVMKKLMETQPDVVILCNDAKSEEAVPAALIAYARGIAETLALANASIIPNMRPFEI